MRLSPNDIRKTSFAKAMRGLDAEEVQAFLDTVAEQAEERERELETARARIEELESQVRNYRSMEDGLRDTLMAVQNSTQETREQARREAELILKQAEVDAAELLRTSREQLAGLRAELVTVEAQRTSFVTRIRALLKGQLDLLEVLAAARVEEVDPPAAPARPGKERTPDEKESPATGEQAPLFRNEDGSQN